MATSNDLILSFEATKNQPGLLLAATKRIIDAQDGPVLLIGHSYGGAEVTAT